MTFGRCSNQLSGPTLLIIRALLHPTTEFPRP
jgi:hypothetical protein